MIVGAKACEKSSEALHSGRCMICNLEGDVQRGHQEFLASKSIAMGEGTNSLQHETNEHRSNPGISNWNDNPVAVSDANLQILFLSKCIIFLIL